MNGKLNIDEMQNNSKEISPTKVESWLWCPSWWRWKVSNVIYLFNSKRWMNHNETDNQVLISSFAFAVITRTHIHLLCINHHLPHKMLAKIVVRWVFDSISHLFCHHLIKKYKRFKPQIKPANTHTVRSNSLGSCHSIQSRTCFVSPSRWKGRSGVCNFFFFPRLSLFRHYICVLDRIQKEKTFLPIAWQQSQEMRWKEHKHCEMPCLVLSLSLPLSSSSSSTIQPIESLLQNGENVSPPSTCDKFGSVTRKTKEKLFR